eukprot:TRINITY_DN4764_c0_g2_i2.p1 TRINITY_DN4764_c0_g2~~TRINITY_DN4764_c0_g2_i2.p1  ORF type:complete len:291 (+),score=45.76 TRINITY_DN4764_c0_g2_i2:156-1028(+)
MLGALWNRLVALCFKPRVVCFNQSEQEYDGIDSIQLCQELEQHWEGLFNDVASDNGCCVKYNKVAANTHFQAWQNTSKKLKSIDLASLPTDTKAALLINIYNVLTIEAIVSRRSLPSSVLDIPKFWQIHTYQIGEHTYSLDDIEHGLLRARPHPSKSGADGYFGSNDPRAMHAMQALDCRIHFALVCAAKSCPRLRVFHGDSLQSELSQAAQDFCTQHVLLKSNNDSLKAQLSMILKWYGADFGKTLEARLRTLQPYLMSEQADELDKASNFNVSYNNYDWSLNRCQGDG